MAIKPYIRKSPDWLDEYTLTLSSFAGGMNNINADTTLNDNEVSDSKNMMFVSGDLLEKRYGTKEYDPVNLSAYSEAIVYIDFYKQTNGTVRRIISTNSAVYDGKTKICDVNGAINGTNYMGKYYFVDGTNIYCYDGTTYYIIKQQPQATIKSQTSTTVVVVDEVPATVKVGDPYYFIIGSDKKEGTVSTIDGTSITLSASITEDSITEDTLIFFYKPKGTSYQKGEEIWDSENHIAYYLPCANELSSAFYGSGFIPNAPDVIVVHKDRLVVSGDTESPQTVFIGFLNNPLYFPVGASVSAKPNGDKIIDMIVFDNALIIGRNTDIYALYGSSELQNLSDDPFNIKQMDVSIGFMHRNCGALLNNYYIYLGYDGRFYRLNSPATYVEYVVAKPLAIKIDIYETPFSLSKTSVVNTSTIPFYNEVWFCLDNDIVIVYNYDLQAFTYYQGMKAKCLYTNGTEVYIGRSDGKLAIYDNENDDRNDCGENIDAYFWTKRFDLKMSAKYKYFKRFMITSHAYDEINSKINVDIEVDYFYNRESISYNSNISRFGTARFGINSFNNRNIYKSGYINIDARGRTIKFKFYNSELDEPFRIYDINVLWSERDVR